MGKSCTPAASVALSLALFIAMAPIPGFSQSSQERVVVSAIDQVFRPTMLALKGRASELANEIDTACASDGAKQAFNRAVVAFSVLEYFRIGPMNQDNRAERLFFWPDRKGTGERQLRRLLADPGSEQLDAATLAGKSVAVQGLPALEKILFDSADGSGTDHCVLAAALAKNIRDIAAELHEQWQLPEGISAQLVTHNETAVYRNTEESLAAFLTLASSGLEAIKDRKLAPVIEALAVDDTLPRTAPFVHSGLSIENLRANLQGIESLVVDSGLAGLVGRGVEDQWSFEMSTVNALLDVATDALALGDIDTAGKRLKAVRAITGDLRDVVEQTMAPALGMSTGFNSGDGD